MDASSFHLHSAWFLEHKTSFNQNQVLCLLSCVPILPEELYFELQLANASWAVCNFVCKSTK